MPTSAPTIAVSAKELRARYRENEAAADQDYAGLTLLVSGPVTEIDLGDAGHPVVLLGDPEDGLLARAELNSASGDKATSLSEGDQVVVRCSGVTELAGAPLLLNCQL